MVIDGFDLRREIRDELARSGIVEPKRVRDRVLSKITSRAVIDRLAVYGLERVVEEELRHARVPRRQSPEASRWRRHRLTIDLLGVAISVDGSLKDIATCTAEDLESYAADQKMRAEGLLRAAEKAIEIATELRAAGAATVADLYASEDLAA